VQACRRIPSRPSPQPALQISTGAYAFCETTSVWTGIWRFAAMSRFRTAFVKGDGPACSAVWGAPVPLSDAQLNNGRGCEGAPVGTACYIRMAETEANDAQYHITLHDDLVEHMWADSGSLTSPDVRLSNVGGLREYARLGW